MRPEALMGERGGQNVLVIGGSYFSGRVFVEELLAAGGYVPYVLNRGSRPLGLAGVKELVCDRRDAGGLGRVVPPLDWHAVVDFCAYDPGDIATLLGSLPGSVGRYIYISTATVHHNSLHLPIREDAPKLTVPLPGPGGGYAHNKWLIEGELGRLCGERGIGHVSLRPAFIYGKYNYAPRESYFFDLIARQETIILPSPPQALFSMVSVWDLARICIACLGNEQVGNGAYTVCSDELVSYDLIIEVLEAITSNKYQVRRQPVRLINAAGLPLPFPLEEHLVYSGARLQDRLGYHYLPLLEGLTRTYAWYLERGTR